MNDTMDTTAPGHVTSRRSVLTAGTAGLAATALLAACSDDGPTPGLSGAPVTATSVAPTVPEKEPTQAELQADRDTFATANSLELLAADLYRRFGPDLQDLEMAAAAERFATDHEAAAELFAAEAGDHDGLGEPNAYLMENQVSPVEDLLTNDAAIANLASTIESSIAATYITAVGTLLDPQWRQTMMTHGAAAARRSAVLGNGGTGSAPRSALYPLSDLISTDAYLTTPAEGEAPAGGEGDAAEGEAAG
jgi:hypothetical protein